MISKLDWFLVSILDHFFITFGLPNGSQMTSKSAKSGHFGMTLSGNWWLVCRPCSKTVQNRLWGSKSDPFGLKKWPLGLQKWPLGTQKWPFGNQKCPLGVPKWSPTQEKLSFGLKKLYAHTKQLLWMLKTIHYLSCRPQTSQHNTTHNDNFFWDIESWTNDTTGHRII